MKEGLIPWDARILHEDHLSWVSEDQVALDGWMRDRGIFSRLRGELKQPHACSGRSTQVNVFQIGQAGVRQLCDTCWMDQ